MLILKRLCYEDFWIFLCRIYPVTLVKLGLELLNFRMKNWWAHIVTFALSTCETQHTSQTHWKPWLRLTPSWTHCVDGEKWSKRGLNHGDSCPINGSICAQFDKNRSIELCEKFGATKGRSCCLSLQPVHKLKFVFAKIFWTCICTYLLRCKICSQLAPSIICATSSLKFQMFILILVWKIF